MMLRRLQWGVPLAALVGLLVHVVAAGCSHVPGLGHAPTLFAALTAGLALAVLTAFLGAALRPGRFPIATNGTDAKPLAALAAAGFAAYLLLELIEGHGLAGALPALTASLPIAALVWRAAQTARMALRAAGRAFAAFAQAAAVVAAPAFATLRSARRPGVRVVLSRAHRGRAPPLFA